MALAHGWLNGPRSGSARDTGVRSVARQQWTPDLAEDIAQATSVIFIDCAANSAPGQIQLEPVKPSAACRGCSLTNCPRLTS